MREYVRRRKVVEREAGIAMEWREEERPAGGAVFFCEVRRACGGGLEA